MVAKWQRKEPVALIDMEAMDGEGAALRGIKSTKL